MTSRTFALHKVHPWGRDIAPRMGVSMPVLQKSVALGRRSGGSQGSLLLEKDSVSCGPTIARDFHCTYLHLQLRGKPLSAAVDSFSPWTLPSDESIMTVLARIC